MADPQGKEEAGTEEQGIQGKKQQKVAFSEQSRAILEASFESNPRPGKAQVEHIAAEVCASVDQVRKWFQRRRRKGSAQTKQQPKKVQQSQQSRTNLASLGEAGIGCPQDAERVADTLADERRHTLEFVREIGQVVSDLPQGIAASSGEGLRRAVALMAEGSDLPLSQLVHRCVQQLYSAGCEPSESAVRNALLKVSQREPLKGNESLDDEVDILEDSNFEHAWRWRVGEEGLIPKEYLGCVKEMRGKISACKARIGALDNVEKGLREAASSDDWSAPGLAGALASLAKCEPIIEGGWKPEVEALPEGKSKADKEAERKASKDVKQAEKEAKDAECEKARKAKEDERARKQMERDQARRAKRDSEEQKKKGIEKQQMVMKRFFVPIGSRRSDQSDHGDLIEASNEASERDTSHIMEEALLATTPRQATKDLLDEDKSRWRGNKPRRKGRRWQERGQTSQVVAVDPFKLPSSGVQACGTNESAKPFRRKLLQVPFDADQRAYARPAFWGSWPSTRPFKETGTITGRRPLGRDERLDYEEESADEWEEEEPGESVDQSENEEEANASEEELDNGFIVPSGHLSEDEHPSAEPDPETPTTSHPAMGQSWSELEGMLERCRKSGSPLLLSRLSSSPGRSLDLLVALAPEPASSSATLPVCAPSLSQPAKSQGQGASQFPERLVQPLADFIRAEGSLKASHIVKAFIERHKQEAPGLTASSVHSKLRELAEYKRNAWSLKAEGKIAGSKRVEPDSGHDADIAGYPAKAPEGVSCGPSPTSLPSTSS